jgi:FkbM family methyltransferase
MKAVKSVAKSRTRVYLPEMIGIGGVDTLALFDALLLATRPAYVYDIGALNGDESRRFRKLLPDAAITAIEANPYNYNEFLGDLSAHNVRTFHTALSDYTGVASFHVLKRDGPASNWLRAAGSLYPRTSNEVVPEEVVKVPVTTLDVIAAGAVGPTALWIDVEGALEDVLAGAVETLKQTVLIHAEVEHHQFWRDQALYSEVAQTLEDAGFQEIAYSGVAQQANVIWMARRR